MAKSAGPSFETLAARAPQDEVRGLGGRLLSGPCVPRKEQCLARDGRHHRGLERFRDQERRLRALAGKEAFRISRDENYRYLERLEQLIDRVQTGAAVGQLN